MWEKLWLCSDDKYIMIYKSNILSNCRKTTKRRDSHLQPGSEQSIIQRVRYSKTLSCLTSYPEHCSPLSSSIPNKHETLAQACFNVGPTPQTKTQHESNIGYVTTVTQDLGVDEEYPFNVTWADSLFSNNQWAKTLLTMIIIVKQWYN